MAVTACVIVAPVWLLWVHRMLFTANKTLFVLFTETHFFLAFSFFMSFKAVRTVEISLAVFTVNGAYFTRFKIWATTFIFVGTCSLAAGTTATHTRMMSGVLCIVPLTAVRAEVGPVEECHHTS